MPTQCPCCLETYDMLDDMRWWSGVYAAREEAEADTGKLMDRICENCHREGKARRLN